MTLESLAGLGWERPFYGVAIWVFMLGFAGFPLTGGLFGKLFVFSAAYEAGDWWLVLVGRRRDDGLARVLPERRPLAVHALGAELRLAPAGGSPPCDPRSPPRSEPRSSSRSGLLRRPADPRPRVDAAASLPFRPMLSARPDSARADSGRGRTLTAAASRPLPL